MLHCHAGMGMTHPVFIAFEWDEFCRIAFELRGHCSQIVNLLKQPVTRMRRRPRTHPRCPHGRPRSHMHTHPHTMPAQHVPRTVLHISSAQVSSCAAASHVTTPRSTLALPWHVYRVAQVPWAYFHLLNLMIFLVLFLLGYGLVGMAEWPVTLAVHAAVCLIFMGMKELAIAMADPFGDDTIDFELERYLGTIYSNALAQLSDHFEPTGHALPDGISNPLPEHTHERAGGDGDPRGRDGGAAAGGGHGGGVDAGGSSEMSASHPHTSSHQPAAAARAEMSTKMPSCSDALAKATHRGSVLAESAGAPRATTFWPGARVEHPSRGVGTVTGHLDDGRTLVKFDSGEVHRYKHASMGKFKSHGIGTDEVKLSEGSAAAASFAAGSPKSPPKSASKPARSANAPAGDGDESGGMRRGSSFAKGPLTLTAGV